MGVNIRHDCDGAGLIAFERNRQKMEEKYSEIHDSDHDNDELLLAAISYIENIIWPPIEGESVPEIWPWEQESWKPKDRKRNLIRAGALIAAELDRMWRLDDIIIDSISQGKTK